VHHADRSRTSFVARAVLAAALLTPLAGLVAPPAGQAQQARERFHVTAPGVDPRVVAEIRADLAWAEPRITERLGPFRDTVSVRIFPHREGFTDALQEAWGIPETACWMVGAADDHHLFLLSPAAWTDEACEHDPSDAAQRRMLVAHEAVHVLHGQVNPSADVGLLEEIGWFVEGLATWASGQLETAHAGRAAEALAAGKGPERLADAWSGPWRYGVAGSLVAYIDARWGRETLRAALAFTTWSEFERALGVSEAGFLDGWRRWVEAGGAQGSASRGTDRAS
jgi:hypothetical protein